MTFHWRPRHRRAAVGRPLFDDAIMLLEDRIMLDAVPAVTVTPPDHVFLTNPANNFQVTLTFDNHAGSQPGYGPYIEVIVPKNGADGVAHGAANADGATFVGATYLGQSVTIAANLTFNAAGHATNPLSGDVVNGTPGDGLVVLQLPFGSFTPPQTTAAIVATFAQSPLGNVGVPLTIAARGGFQFGLDPLDNPTVDPHIVGAPASATYSPTIAILTKTSDAPANLQEETATGPNNSHFYTLNLDVAAGQTLTNAMLSDALPDSIVYLGATITNGTGTITHQPTIGAVVNPADNLLSVSFASVTGTAATTDAVVRVHFYVNDVHFDGTPVVNPTTGAIVSTVNSTHLTSTFTPIDPIDPVATFMLDATHPDTIQDKPIAIQKSAVIAVDTGPAGLNSGDTIEYRLTIQVSDYFTLGNLSLTDTLSDGQRLDTSFAPTIQLTERGVATPTTAIAGVLVGPTAAGDVTTGHEFTGNFASAFNAATGVTTSTINLSNVVPGGLLAGGRTLPTDGAGVGGTTVTIVFRAVVQNNFETDTLDAAHRAVHQGDTVGNAITIAGSIRDNAVPTTVLGATAIRDDGAASVTIARGGVTKSIYAINGDTNLADFTVGGSVQLVAGDRITYRLVYDLPITSYQALSLTDFLPLPVLAARSLTLNNAAPFVAGNFAYGPTDTLHLTANAPAPVESFDAAGNSVKFVYPDYSLQNQGAPSRDSKIDLLFTVAVQDSTIADGLFLTNLATSSESNTPGNATSGNSIVRFALGQPRLVVQKAIVSATSGTITTPETVAGVTFLAPGVVSATGLGYTATAPITDASLGATTTAAAPRLNSNVVGLDAGDSARVALVINNQGSGANGAFNAVVADTLATGTSFLGGSLASANLIVSRGDGTVFHAGTDYTVTASATGFTINFVDGATGKVERNGAADNGDIVLVTYDIKLSNSVVISPATLSSSATIPSFAAVAAGVNQVTVVPTDAATIGLLQPTVVKALVSTTDASTTGGNLTIGENATYQVTYTLAEGTTSLVRLVDMLPVTAANGQYQFVSASIVSVGANLKQANGVTPIDATYFGPVVIASHTGNVTATFGGAGVTIVDTADNVVSGADQIVVNYVVRAANVAANTNGLTGVNTGELLYANTQVTATAPIGISLPDLTVVKAFVPNANPTPDAGDPVNFTITVTNPGTVTGYAVALNDPLPAGLTNVTITGVAGAGLTAADFSTAGNTLTLLNHLSLAGGQSFTVSFAATLSGGVNPGGSVTNVATLDFATGDGTQGPVRTVEKTGAASVTINADTIAKSIFTTSVGNDNDSNVVIGELVSFDLTTSLAEGTSNALTIVDVLPTGLVFVSGQVVAVGAHVSGATLAPAVTTPGGVPTFAFGTVTDLADNTPQTAADQIVVRVVARVADVASNVSHTVLTDTATVATTTAGATISRSVALPVTVTVPDVVIAKTVTSRTAPDAGDTVTFAINVMHAADSTATAFNLRLADALPAGLANLQVVGINNDPTGTGAHGLALTPASFTTAGNSLALAGPLDLALGQAFTVTISAVVTNATVVGSTIVNDANLQFATLPGNDPTARAFSHDATATFTTASGQALVKSVVATDDALTGTSQFRAGVTDLAIGETATVQLVATFVQGTTPGVVLVDHLPVNVGPAGMAATFGFTGAPVLTPGPGVTFTGSGTGVLSDTDGDGIADTVTYTLGAVTVPGTPGAGTGTVTVSYGTTPLDRPENAAGDALASPAALTSALGSLAANVDYDLVAPNLVVTKAVQVNPPGADAGDLVVYTIHLANLGTGPAADIALTDVLPPGLVVVAGGAVSVDGGPYLFQPIPTLAPGSVADVFYTVLVRDSAVAGSVQTNVANVTYDSHAGPGGRPATTSASASFTTLASQALTKTITQTSDPLTGTAQFRPGVTDLAIGETATVQLVATLQQGTTTNVVITDHLPVNVGPPGTAATFGFTGVPVLSLPAGASVTGSTTPVLTDTNGDGIADTVTYNLGNVTITGNVPGVGSGPGTAAIAIGYTTRALDRPENAAGDALASPAALTSGLGSLAANVDYDLVAPNLVVTKAVSIAAGTPGGTPDAGDTVSYTVTLTNTGSGPAEAIVLTDPGPAGVRLSNALITVGGSTTSGTLQSGVGVPALSPGATATITYTGIVTDAALVGQAEVNTATATYASSTSGGHVGTAAATATFTTASGQALVKSVVATDDALTGTSQFRAGVTDLAIGETATVQLVATFVQGTTPGVVLVDHLPVNVGPAGTAATFGFTGAPVLTLGPGVTFTGSGTGVLSDTDGDGIADTVTYTLGAVTVPGTPGAGTGTVTVSYGTTPLDRPENAAGDALASPAALTSALGSLAANVDYDLVAPNLVVTKAVAVAAGTPGGTPDAGDTVSYTVTLTNTGSGPAEGLTFADAGPPNVQLGSATVTAGGTSFVASLTGGLTLPPLLPGARDTITYAGIISDTAVAGSVQTNTATATFTSSGLNDGSGRHGTASSTASFTTAAAQTFTKAIVATSVPSSGSAQFRPGATDLVIGEQATFELVATLPEGTTPGVVITDHLPVAAPGDVSTAGTLTFVGTPTVTIGGVVVTVQPGQIVQTDTNGDGIPDTITLYLGNVTIPGTNNAANDTVRIRYDVLAPDLAVNAAGDLLTSPAVLASSLGTLTAAVDIDLVQPALTITTTADVATVKAGDIVTYTVMVANPASSAPAEEVVLTDLLAGSPLSLVVGSVTTSQGVITSGNGPADTTVAVGLGTVPVGAPPVTITFRASVTAVVPGITVDTVASVIYDGIPGIIDGQPGRSATATADAAIGVVGFAKTITGTSLPETGSAQFRPGAPDLAIGETATFALTVTLPAGTTSVAVTDLLGDSNGHLELVGAPHLTVSTGVVAGPLTTTRPDLNGDGVADLGFAVGPVTAPAGGGTVVITYVARVSDIPGNVAGGQLDLPATAALGTSTLTDSRAVDLVAPIITLAKVATTVGAHAGGTVGYTLTTTNSGSGPAYDLTLTDALPSGLQVVPGTVRLTVAGVATAVGSPQSLAIPLLDAGQVAVLHFDTVIGDSAVAGGTLTNNAAVTFDSLAGPGGRPGSATASAAIVTDGLQALTKTIIATSEPFTGTARFRPGVPDLTVGESATFELRATFSAGTTNNVVLTDTLQVSQGTLTLTGTPVIVLADGTTAPFTGSVTTVDLNGDGVPDQVRFALGNVTIPGNAAGSIAIRYQAVAADRPENHAGDLLTLPATLTSAIGTSTASAAVDLVAPSLTVTKQLAATQPVDGQSTVFILTVGHAANSSAAATGIVLGDLLPAGSLLAGPATIVSGPVGAIVTGGTVTVPLLNSGDTLVVRVTTIADFTHPATGDTVNRATLSYGTTTGGGGHLGQGSASAVVPLTTIVSTIRFPHDDIVGLAEDRRYVSPLLPIEPVYSGAAEPGSFVELVVTDEFGSISGAGGALTDAGGNWLIRLPSTSIDTLLRDATLNDYYASTRLFSPPDTSLFADRDLFGYARPNGIVDVGSVPAFGTQVVHINVSDSSAGFTALYAPTWRDQVFVEEPGLSIERAFSGAAGRSIRHLYDELAAPEAAGLNRFNHAFLSAADL